MGRKIIDITGKKFNKLTVIKFDKEKSNNKNKYWICKCDCGNIKSIEGNKIKNGLVKGCGCLRGKNNIKYSIQNKKLYKLWWHIINRCNNKKDISYKNYGGRGIKVCDEWLEYDNFAIWCLKNNYKEGLEIDRINNNGNYEPDNCRFVTRLENSRNKRNSIKYNYKGKLLSLKEIADLNNINYKLLWQKINRDGINIENI